jgi:hypothetical protein
MLVKYGKIYFSSLVKRLISEKLEDLQDNRAINSIVEGSPEDYLSGEEIDQLFDK